LVRQGYEWQLASIAYPSNVYANDSDYAPATNWLLSWTFTGGAGPSDLAVGRLTVTDLSTQAKEVVLPDNVVSAGWAPNGLDFAYIMAVPDTYELRWRAATGEDKLLAVDVPHTLRISPDGRSVAFTRESSYGLAADPGLYVVEIETGTETQVSPLLLLYAVADTDRAAISHEAGYAWAAADGSFAHFLPESAFLAHFDEPPQEPDAIPCLSKQMLFASGRMVLGVGECHPMAQEGPASGQPAYYALNAKTGDVALVDTPSLYPSAELLTWDKPGESVLLQEDGRVISRTLMETGGVAPIGP
jgi:hypothetical protein